MSQHPTPPTLPPPAFYTTTWPNGPTRNGTVLESPLIEGLMLEGPDGKAALANLVADAAERHQLDLSQPIRSNEAKSTVRLVVHEVISANATKYGWSRIDDLSNGWVYEAVKGLLLRLKSNKRRHPPKEQSSSPQSIAHPKTPTHPAASVIPQPPSATATTPSLQPALAPPPSIFPTASPTSLHLMTVGVKMLSVEETWEDALTTFRIEESRSRSLANLTVDDFSLPLFKAALADHEQSPFRFDDGQHELTYEKGDGTTIVMVYPNLWRAALLDGQRSGRSVAVFHIRPKTSSIPGSDATAAHDLSIAASASTVPQTPLPTRMHRDAEQRAHAADPQSSVDDPTRAAAEDQPSAAEGSRFARTNLVEDLSSDDDLMPANRKRRRVQGASDDDTASSDQESTLKKRKPDQENHNRQMIEPPAADELQNLILKSASRNAFNDVSDLPSLMHLEEKVWEECCEFYLHDPNQSAATQVVVCRGFRPHRYPRTYQAYAVYWMLRQLTRRIFGCILADGVGVGKTLETYLYAWTQCEIVAAGLDVERSRSGRPNDGVRSKAHLPRSTAQNPQARDAVCPSQSSWGVQCPCVERSISSTLYRLIPNGAVLIATPPKLISQWRQEFYATFDATLARSPCRQMRLFIEHHDFPKDSVFHPASSEPKLPKTHLLPNDFPYNCTRLVFLTAANASLTTRIGAQRAFNIPGRSFFSVLIRDEFHEVHSLDSVPSKFFKSEVSKYDEHSTQFTSILGLSATPIVTRPSNILTILDALAEDGTWGEEEYPMPSLRNSRPAAILELDKRYRQMLNESPAPEGSKEARAQKAAKDQYCLDLSKALGPIMIARRSTDEWFGEKLVRLPEIHASNVFVSTKEEHVEAIQHLADGAKRAALERHERLVDTWRKNGCKGPQPTRTDSNLRSTRPFRQVRLCADFPAYASLVQRNSDEDLEIGVKFIEDNQLYTAKEGAKIQGTWYGRYLKGMIDGSSKFEELKKFLNEMKDRDPDAKMVIACSSPAVVVLLRLCMVGPLQTPAVVLHPTMSNRDRASLVRSFNEQVVDDRFENPAAAAARVLIANIDLLATGYNIQRANHVCIFGLPWTRDKVLQCMGRVFRSGQEKETYIKTFIAMGNGIEKKIFQCHTLHEVVTELSYDITTGAKEAAQQRQAVEQSSVAV